MPPINVFADTIVTPSLLITFLHTYLSVHLLEMQCFRLDRWMPFSLLLNITYQLDFTVYSLILPKIPAKSDNTSHVKQQVCNHIASHLAQLTSACRNADVPRTPVRDMYTKSRGVSDRLVATVPSGGSIGFDRLNNCPNTRFHAVNLFHSYFFRVTDKKLSTKLSMIMSAAQSLKGCNDSLTTSRASSSEDSDADVLHFIIMLKQMVLSGGPWVSLPYAVNLCAGKHHPASSLAGVCIQGDGCGERYHSGCNRCSSNT